jgi:hypothetical protein
MRLFAQIALRDGPGAPPRAAVEQALAALPREVPALRRSALSLPHAGSVGALDLFWDALVTGDDALALLDAPAWRRLLAPGGPVARVDAVALAPVWAALPEPALGRCVKRTLLLRVHPDAPPASVARFERDLAGMPRHIGAIRNWSLSRADAARWPTPWTHVWEQEFHDASGLERDYMLHPYHWGYVDAWFDPEMPHAIVEPALAHLYAEVPASILAWGA